MAGHWLVCRNRVTDYIDLGFFNCSLGMKCTERNLILIWSTLSRLSTFTCVLLQVRTFYTQVLNEEERQRLCQNMAGALKGAQLFIQKRMVSPHQVIVSTRSKSACVSCCHALIEKKKKRGILGWIIMSRIFLKWHVHYLN